MPKKFLLFKNFKNTESAQLCKDCSIVIFRRLTCVWATPWSTQVRVRWGHSSAWDAARDGRISMMSLRILRKAILFLLTLACWKETLDMASWVIYTVIVVETDYRTSSLKVRGDIDSWVSQLFYTFTALHLLAVG